MRYGNRYDANEVWPRGVPRILAGGVDDPGCVDKNRKCVDKKIESVDKKFVVN